MQMMMQKASPQEIENGIKLCHLLEGCCDGHPLRGLNFPDTEDKPGRPFDPDCIEDLKEFYEQCVKLSQGHMRVCYGYSVLVDNCCDPDKDYLAFKPGLVYDQDPGDYPECSGDPVCCPENEGHGCCDGMGKKGPPNE